MNEHEICSGGVHLRMCAGPNAKECTECEPCIICTKRIKKVHIEAHIKRHEKEKDQNA